MQVRNNQFSPYFRHHNKLPRQFCVTPELFIKFILTFNTLHANKVEEISSRKNRYHQGLEKLNHTAKQVYIYIRSHYKQIYAVWWTEKLWGKELSYTYLKKTRVIKVKRKLLLASH